MNTASKFVRWDVPFAEASFPSVTLITQQHIIQKPQKTIYDDAAILVVKPASKQDHHIKKHLVYFDRIIAFLCYEESNAFDRDYPSSDEVLHSCAGLWIDSPWLMSYRRGEEAFGWQGLQHYVVFGGDSIVELLALGQPRIEQFEGRKIIETKHEV